MMEQIKNFKKVGFHYSLTDIEFPYDFIRFLYIEANKAISNKFESLFKQFPKSSFKFKYDVKIRFLKMQDGKQISQVEPWFSCQTATLYQKSDLPKLLKQNAKAIESHFDVFVFQGSGFIFDCVLELFLSVVKFYPLSGGISSGYSLPMNIKKRRAIDSNISYDKDRCFLQCINQYYAKQKINADLDISNLSFPTSINEIKLFEKRNGLSINVFGYYQKEQRLIVYYHSKNHTKHCIDLLLWKEHYYLITDLSRLIGKRWSKKNQKKYICRSCLTYYFSKNRYTQHVQFCANDGQVYNYPPANQNKLKFDNYSAMVKSDYTIYYDFECSMKKVENEQIQHIPMAIGSVRICNTNSKLNSKLFTYVGEDCVDKFLNWLEKQKHEIEIMSLIEDKPLFMTRRDSKYFRKQKNCEMCGIRFNRINKKCADHCHLSGIMRYVLCNRCNLTFAKRSQNVPCLCHNNMKYDLHFLIEALSKSNKKKFNIIGKNKENYIRVDWDVFIFLDSFSFLNSSLAKLVETNNNFPILHLYMNKVLPDCKILCQKGIFPYEYITSLEKLGDKHLPPIHQFYSSITNEHITLDEYTRAQQVWSLAKCKSLKDYMLVYLKSDVLLLADCFENYRNLTYDTFQLDPVHFVSSPHLSWHSMLRYTKVELELMIDGQMVSFIEHGIRGGVSAIINKYAKANIMSTDSFNDKLPPSEIAYFDCVNMYGFNLGKRLPLNNFHWLTNDEIKNFDVNDISNDSEKGYILEVDLTYPSHLHDLHNDFPLAPEKIEISPSQWSPYMHEIAASSCMQIGKGTQKLIPHFGPRKHYVIHYCNLKFYLKMGLQLDRIHRILGFSQSRWMKPYIDFNTERRKNAQSEFESQFYKLQVNSVYGKTLENPRRRSLYKLVSDKESFYKYTKKPTFKSITIYNPNFACIELKKEIVTLNKPFASGFAVLELSKLHLYQFHYNYIKRLYGNRSKLLFTDTDSLSYEIRDSNVNMDMYKNKDKFDLSNFHPNSPYHSDQNKKRIGTFKKEHPNDSIIEFVGLRAKMYSLKFLSNKDEKKAKGIKRSVMKRCSHKNFAETLFNRDKDKTISYYSIRSKKHKLYTKKEQKKFLSAFDDKRYFLNETESLAHYHYNIPT